MWTLDATIIATALGQLLDEGRIDIEAKPIINIAVRRQLHPSVLSQHQDEFHGNRIQEILTAVARVVESA